VTCLPNIVWMSGGDYYVTARRPNRGPDVDHCIDAMVRGIREAGDGRPFSIQLNAEKSISTQYPYWARRVDWNFVYTYYPTYKGVLDAYRRQVLWSLTSGAAGEFLGTHDWDLHQGWERRLSSRALTQIARVRTLFSTLRWWELVPDTGSELFTGGRGTELTTDEPKDVLENDYVTAARTPDGRLAVVYLPARRTIAVDPSAMAAGTRATWVDPTSGARRPVPMSGRFTPPGPNAAGDNDWLLVLTG